MPACACLQPGVVFLAVGPPCLAECSPLPAHRLQRCLHSLFSILPGEFTMIELAEMVKKVVNPKAEVRHGWHCLLAPLRYWGRQLAGLPAFM